jgi:hypothetical protein
MRKISRDFFEKKISAKFSVNDASSFEQKQVEQKQVEQKKVEQHIEKGTDVEKRDAPVLAAVINKKKGKLNNAYVEKRADGEMTATVARPSKLDNT